MKRPTWDSNTDEFVLSTGKRFYAHAARLSIGESVSGHDGNELRYGYDGVVGSTLTPEERMEIAQYMIDLWKNWGDPR